MIEKERIATMQAMRDIDANGKQNDKNCECEAYHNSFSVVLSSIA